MLFTLSILFVVHYENFIGLASNDDEDEIIEAPSQPKNSRNLVPQKNIYTPRLIGALDKCGVTNRRAVHLISATIATLDLKIQNYVLSRNSIGRY